VPYLMYIETSCVSVDNDNTLTAILAAYH